MLDDTEDSPDAAFSLTAEGLRHLCEDARTAWAALGRAGYERRPAEEASLKFRRSLYFVKDMKTGETITPECIRSIRPGSGLAPKHYEALIGKCVKTGVARGTAVSWELVSPAEEIAERK